MIQFGASAVFLLRDGYSGKPVPPTSLLCTLDGWRHKPLSKPGGYLILTDLPPGPHRLAVVCRGFQEEWVDFETGLGHVEERLVLLKPSDIYRFPDEVTRLELALTDAAGPARGVSVWLCVPGRTELKLAQDKVQAGETQLRLYCRGGVSRLALPGDFLIQDANQSEVCLIRGLEGEMATLAAPLERSHPRGKLLLLAQRYRADDEGRLTAVFHGPGQVSLVAEGDCHCRALELTPGKNALTVALH